MRTEFLAEASAVLASSLDYEVTLAAVARLAVPQMADWCVVDMARRDGALNRLAVAHADPEKVAWAHELDGNTRPTPTRVPARRRLAQRQVRARRDHRSDAWRRDP